jgi:hypothetical protein
MNVNVAGRSRSARQGVVAAIGALLVAGATGCKTGTAGMKPSWWTFGGGSQEEAAKLAAAPSFNGSTEKPSASAKPYPTTTTPNGYVLGGSAPAAGAVAGDPVAAAAPITYGVTPPPAKADPVAVATAPASTPSTSTTGGSLASISPQVGPYAALPSETPAAPSSLPPLQPIAAAAPTVPDSSGFSAPPPAAPVAPPDMQRVADARGAAGWPAQQTASPSASAGSRYDSVTGSRFGGGGSAIDQPLQPPAAASAFPAAAMPAALEPLPAAPPSAAAPLATPLTPPPSVPTTGFPAPPAGFPASVPPPASAPPARRPDPGYRPGGTSSYRPNRAILAADPLESEPGDVRTVGFEAPAAAGP